MKLAAYCFTHNFVSANRAETLFINVKVYSFALREEVKALIESVESELLTSRAGRDVDYFWSEQRHITYAVLFFPFSRLSFQICPNSLHV